MSPRDDSCDSSVASFEDVGRPSATRADRYPDLVHIPGKRTLDEDEISDVMYTVQYCSSSGRVLESRQSDQPLENLEFGKLNQNDGKKKPVIEIVTRYSLARSPPSSDYIDAGFYSPDPNYPSDLCGSPDMPEDTKMIVHSKYLRAALSAVIGYYPGYERIQDNLSIQAPYQVLVHNWKALEYYKLNQPSCHGAEYVAATVKDIDVLLAFLAATYSEKLTAEAKRWDNGTATFELFWVLLKPGDFVYREIFGEMVPFVVSSAHRTLAGDGSSRSTYRVTLWNIHYQNNSMRRRMTQVVVYPWNGERLVSTLPVVPMRFLKGGAKAMVEEQIKYGRMYWELAKQPSYKEYDGKLVFKHGKEGGKITGRVIVDCEGHAQFGEGPPKPGPYMPPPPHMAQRHLRPPIKEDQLPQNLPRCSCKACGQSKQDPSPWAGFDNLNPNEDPLPANEDWYFHAVGPSIAAFVLSERRWAHISISGLSDVRSDQDAFKYLVLDPEIKLTVKSIIGKFASLNGKLAPWPSDFVKNKGEGRIFLLHGSPGVGKTCTAECAAELARRPLLALTSGDISTSMVPSAVEGALNYFLKLGERFGALVLLDEADVYLEQRRARDLQRNGLVSIFLRALEYYRGVLFLTTNRVEAFDDAFTSRIHVALHYKKLGEEERSKIWQQNFERLQRDSANQVFVPQATREYAFESDDMRALQWNGREIRNALQTAVALAETEALEGGLETITVQDRHLRAVVRMSTGFKRFMVKRKAQAFDGVDSYDDDEDEDDGYDPKEEESDE